MFCKFVYIIAGKLERLSSAWNSTTIICNHKRSRERKGRVRVARAKKVQRKKVGASETKSRLMGHLWRWCSSIVQLRDNCCIECEYFGFTMPAEEKLTTAEMRRKASDLRKCALFYSAFIAFGIISIVQLLHRQNVSNVVLRCQGLNSSHVKFIFKLYWGWVTSSER